MARVRKTKIEAQPIEQTEDFPIQHEPGSHDGIFDNVIPFTGNDQPTAETQDTSGIDQFLAQYGIEFI